MGKNLSRRLFLEPLENREVPADLVVLSNLTQKPQSILPGDTKVVADLTLKTSNRRFFGQPTKILFISAFGGGSLSQNTSSLQLMADLNGDRRDGCEAVLATASADSFTDVVDFNMSMPVRVRYAPLHLQVKANFGWLLNSDRLGLELAEANFVDLHGVPVPQSRVMFGGKPPTLHKLQSATFYMVQQQMAASATVRAGDRVSLLQFYVGANQISSAKMMCSVVQGNLANATNYTLVHTNWNGVQDQFIQGVVVNGRLQFDFDRGFSTGNWEVMGTMADGSAGSHLQLGMPMDGTSLVAYDLNGHILKGFRLNGVGGGQLQVAGQTSWATNYTVIA